MKTMLIMLAASLLASVGQSRINLDPNDVGIDDETGRTLLFLAGELTKLAQGQPNALDKHHLERAGTTFAAEPPPDRTTD